MSWRRSGYLSVLVLGLLVTVGCYRAGRYPPVIGANAGSAKADKVKVNSNFGWVDSESDVPDMPIVFVAAESRPEEWKELKSYWNQVPDAKAAPFLLPTIHLGQPPLNAAAALVAANQMFVI